MKKFLTFALLLAASMTAFAQEEAQEVKKEKVKTGINFGPLPAIGYSSDLGWHYGALTDIYWYGDGSKYPEYIWKVNVEASWYSKGNSVYHAFFDSKYLIPGLRVSAAVSYFGNKTTNFYGFNGASALYVPELDKITVNGKTNDYIPEGQGFYLMKRNIFRVATCFQGKFGESNWGWAGGLTYWWLTTGHAENKDLSGYVKNQTPANDLSLYDLYVKHDIIPEQEKNGGHHLELKAGVVFDTRDHENNPSRGTNLEVYFFGSPDILNGDRGGYRNDYLKLAVHFKQFFTLVPERLVFGGHLAYQGLIAGNAPYYMLQSIQSINMKQINTEGLGSTCTLRGTIANRLQGNGYAWANFELRWSFVKFRWINQNWTLATNPFFDMGMIVQPYRPEQMKNLLTDLTTPVNTFTTKDKDNNITGTTTLLAKDFYTEQADGLHMSAGIGLHVIMNQNFNINFEFGKAFFDGKKAAWANNDGSGIGINVGLNYIF